MSDQQFPGFIEDDEPKKKKPAGPPPPAAAQPKAPAKAPVKAAAPPPAAAGAAAPAPAAASPGNYEFEESAPAPKRKAPAQVHAASAAAPPTDAEPATDRAAPAADEPDNPDLKPGSRKDLWSCPHCGTGNKPDRSTCRKCGKTPDDEIEKQWYQKPQIIGGIVGAVVLVILLFSLIGGTDLTLQPADEKHIDSKPRIGGSPATGASHDIENRTFTARKRIAVCGRCIGVNQISVAPNSYTVVMLLGSAARGDASNMKVTFSGEVVEVTGTTNYTVLHLLKGSSNGSIPKVGTILSVAGDLGEMEGLGAYGEYVIWLDGFREEE